MFMNSKHLDPWSTPVLAHMSSLRKHNLNAFLWLMSWFWTHVAVIIRINLTYLCATLIPLAVEKSRQKNPRSLCIQTQTSPDVLSSEKALELTQYKTKCESQSGFILQLKQLLSRGNIKLEALTVVIQHLLSEVRLQPYGGRSLSGGWGTGEEGHRGCTDVLWMCLHEWLKGQV